MTSSRPNHWKQWLRLAEWWYNTNFHTGLQCTPFEALYGYCPPHLSLGPTIETAVPTADDAIMRRQQMQQLLQDNLIKAQERMELYFDLHRTERVFQEGDLVFMKLQPYRQTSLALRKNLKLSSKRYGPFKRHMVRNGNVVAVKILVEWSNLPPEDATWEDYNYIKAKFLDFNP
ncbi:hypothetical protein KY285_027214 [Solanum tuberosum]|nr:hypothetical protein KY289_027424 [Solanum tuberosum]KAH0666008.1 hypothetical protein KY285_027214 [Solanum tuberosum]